MDVTPMRHADIPSSPDATGPAGGGPVELARHLQHAGELLRLAAEAGGVGLWEIDVDTGQARWDRTLRAMLGVGPEFPATYESWLSFLPAEDQHLVAEVYPEALADGEVVCRVVAADGTLRHILIQGHRLPGSDGNVLVGTALDVTAVTGAQQHVATMLESLDEAYLALGADWVISHANQRAVRLFPLPEERLIGTVLWAVFDPGPELSQRLRTAATSRAPQQLEVWHDLLAMWLEARIAPLRDGGLVLFLRDIGARKELEIEREQLLASEQQAHREADAAKAEIAHRAATDELTGALSRPEIERHLARLVTTGGFLLTLDVDDFHRINELGGWESGDEVLQEVVTRIRGEVSDLEVIGRRSGDRFLIVSRRHDAAEVQRLASAVQSAFAAPFEVIGHPESLSASISIARVDPDQDPNDALRGSDVVVGRIRAAGGGAIGWYDERAHADLIERRRLTAELHEALRRDRFVLRYAPIFDLRSRTYVGGDALLRWEHPTRGLVLPEYFLPIAERMGVAERIGNWVVDAALAQLAAWERDRDPERRRARPSILWIRLAARHVRRPGFADAVLSGLRAAGTEPSRLGIELIHPGFELDIAPLTIQLERLRRVGVRVALDLVAAGGVGHAVLHQLPLDVVRFSDELHGDPATSRRGRASIRAVIELGRAMEVDVQACGIESREQLEALGRAGCDLAAGPLLGRPVPGDELAVMARDGLGVLGVVDASSSERRRQPWWKLGLGVGPSPARDDAIAGAEILADDRDGVTGLPGQRTLVKVLVDYLDAGRFPVLAYVEIDSFAALSLARGPEVTESLLRAHARRLYAIEGARAFRVGGGRFAIVLADARRGPVSTQLDLVELAKGPKGLTACVGIAHAKAGTTPQELEHRAGEALSSAQRRGHGSVIDHRASDEATPTATAAQARALYAVLREGYLRVHYQPIVSLGDGSVVGFQALARPQLDHGLAGPAEAFDVAEHLGLAPELDAVCRSSILNDGPGFDLPPSAAIYITVAPQSLGHQSLRSGQLIREVRAAGLEPERVVLQLREHASVPARVFDEEVRWLKERGFQLALDGAGCETSGLRALAAVPYDHLKLATNLLADAREDANSAAMLDALCTFAARAGVKVIATGIESPRLLTFARKLRGSADGAPRIHAAQGYHLGKPRPQPRMDAPLEPL